MVKKMVESQNIPDYFLVYDKDGKSEKLTVLRDKDGKRKAGADPTKQQQAAH